MIYVDPETDTRAGVLACSRRKPAEPGQEGSYRGWPRPFRLPWQVVAVSKSTRVPPGIAATISAGVPPSSGVDLHPPTPFVGYSSC